MNRWIITSVAVIVAGITATAGAQIESYSPQQTVRYGRPAIEPVKVHYAGVVGPVRNTTQMISSADEKPTLSPHVPGGFGSSCSCSPAAPKVVTYTRPAPATVYRPVPAQVYRPVKATVYRPVKMPAKGAYVSRGMYGQTTAFVPGQPVRNFWRYITP